MTASTDRLFDTFRHRVTERRHRTDGKVDIVARFYTGIDGGDSYRLLDEVVVFEKVGPRQATVMLDQLDKALAGAYIQGRANQATGQHDAKRPIPETINHP
jgi:hypothetical protein